MHRIAQQHRPWLPRQLEPVRLGMTTADEPSAEDRDAGAGPQVPAQRTGVACGAQGQHPPQVGSGQLAFREASANSGVYFDQKPTVRKSTGM